ncbi:hypothetical protein L596_030055 [Steinernema carpocapsae]|uniref:Glycine N-acyltransferase-like protein n=1 Tax=Steinernema carpocapsae TaxID=34508 RepID=A0A4U5LRL7_STECR|nr:hypothetical protein L596_030055 [Steinernema carpocapsae]
MAFQVPKSSFESFLSQLNVVPELITIYNTVKQFVTGKIDECGLELFGYPHEEPVLWAVLKKPKYSMNVLLMQAVLCQDQVLKLGVEAIFNFIKGDLRGMDKVLLVAGDKILENVNIKMKKFATHPLMTDNNPCCLFYMDENQSDRLLKEELVAPEGFSFVDLDPKRDAEIVSNAVQENVDQTKERLRKMPSVGVRCKESGQIVAFELCSGIGLITHHFTFPEFRRQGLGRLVELRLCQKVIQKLGIVPVKQVSRKSPEVINMSKRSLFWTVYKEADGSDRLGYYRIYNISRSIDSLKSILRPLLWSKRRGYKMLSLFTRTFPDNAYQKLVLSQKSLTKEYTYNLFALKSNFISICSLPRNTM